MRERRPRQLAALLDASRGERVRKVLERDPPVASRQARTRAVPARGRAPAPRASAAAACTRRRCGPPAARGGASRRDPALRTGGAQPLGNQSTNRSAGSMRRASAGRRGLGHGAAAWRPSRSSRPDPRRHSAAARAIGPQSPGAEPMVIAKHHLAHHVPALGRASAAKKRSGRAMPATATTRRPLRCERAAPG